MDFSLSAKQQQWQKVARDFAQNVVARLARQMDENGEMPHTIPKQMAALKLLGSTLPGSHGGSELDHVSQALVYEELGRACSSVRGFLTVHSSLVMQSIHAWATAEQQEEYLPRMASGDLIGCYALTEPEAGSDAANIQTTALQSGDNYLLNGEKIWITNGNIAHISIVFAQLTGGEFSNKRPHERLAAFLVPTDSPGFRREKMQGKELGHRASDHAHMTFADCRVSASSMLGKPGEGFKIAMSALDYGRLGVAAGALGVHQACLDASLAFVRKRKQFGQRIGDFEMVQSMIAEMKATLEASRSLVYKAAWAKDQGLNSTLDTSIAKYFATEAACKAASDAVLLHGGRGYSNEYPVERYYRDIKGLQIYEGTAHIQKIVIARNVIGKDASV